MTENRFDKKTFGWFCAGVVFLLVVEGVIALAVSGFVQGPSVDSNTFGNLIMGLWGDFAAKTFTVGNLIVSAVPMFVGLCKREWFLGVYDFCRRLPTMIGMLGTLWSLVAADLNEPGKLAGNFSLAICSTILGLVLQILLELYSRVPFLPFASILKESEEKDGEVA